MNADDVLQCFSHSEALLEGHFILRSGLHSRHFFQCAKVLQHPRLAERLCGALSGQLSNVACDAVISPALGGIVVGHEIGRALGRRHIFVEKDEGHLVLRRFAITPGERFIVAEDVVTRGGRVQETVEIVRKHGGKVAAVAVLVDRSEAGAPDFGCPFVSLLRLPIETFPADDLPPDLAAIPAIKPGSR